MLGHKTSLNKFKIIIFSDHNGMKLEINTRKKTGKFTNVWKLNNTLLNNNQLKEEIKKKIRKLPQDKQKQNTTYQNIQDIAKKILRGNFIEINAYTKNEGRYQIT